MGEEGRYHAVTSVVGVSLQDTVGGRVVTSGIHGVRASLVEGGREPHIARSEAGDCDFRHGGGGQ